MIPILHSLHLATHEIQEWLDSCSFSPNSPGHSVWRSFSLPHWLWILPRQLPIMGISTEDDVITTTVLFTSLPASKMNTSLASSKALLIFLPLATSSSLMEPEASLKRRRVFSNATKSASSSTPPLSAEEMGPLPPNHFQNT